MPLKEWELRTIVAGDGDPSWDCLFNAFIYTYQELYGISLNKDEMIQQYIAYTNHNPESGGGANIGSFMNFIQLYGFQGSQNTGGTMNNFSTTQWAAFQLDSSGILHFAIPQAAYRNANGDIMLRCYDPTLKSERDYSYDSLKGVFDINTVPFIDSPISGSYGSYDSFGSYPITGSDGIYYG
ncbi:hypothetical protein K0G24_09870 [Bacteroides thetaiotaomicron]|nr:hypothetical protein [Bacteroides thetaiotaomicron]MCE8968657.1 hypothetical protein [Bacteroides thetaiotaomicron]